MIASGDNGIEPLIGVYPRNTGPIIEKLLLMGRYRARDILEGDRIPHGKDTAG